MAAFLWDVLREPILVAFAVSFAIVCLIVIVTWFIGIQSE